MKNPNDFTGDQIRNLPHCSTVPQPTTPSYTSLMGQYQPVTKINLILLQCLYPETFGSHLTLISALCKEL
jgi:hypothetical protein